MHSKQRNLRALGTIVYHAFVMLLGMMMIYPLVWMLKSSFKPSNTIMITADQLIPAEFTLEN